MGPCAYAGMHLTELVQQDGRYVPRNPRMTFVDDKNTLVPASSPRPLLPELLCTTSHSHATGLKKCITRLVPKRDVDIMLCVHPCKVDMSQTGRAQLACAVQPSSNFRPKPSVPERPPLPPSPLGRGLLWGQRWHTHARLIPPPGPCARQSNFLTCIYYYDYRAAYRPAQRSIVRTPGACLCLQKPTE